jgi:hypothetical protein
VVVLQLVLAVAAFALVYAKGPPWLRRWLLVVLGLIVAVGVVGVTLAAVL